MKNATHVHMRMHERTATENWVYRKHVASYLVLPTKYVHRFGFNFVFPLKCNFRCREMKNEMFSVPNCSIRLGEQSVNREMISLDERMHVRARIQIHRVLYSQLHTCALWNSFLLHSKMKKFSKDHLTIPKKRGNNILYNAYSTAIPWLLLWKYKAWEWSLILNWPIRLARSQLLNYLLAVYGLREGRD